MLTAGVGTVAFGSVMYLVKGIPLWFFGMFRRFLTIEVSLTSESALYHELLGVLTRHRIGAFARLYTTDKQGHSVSGYGNSLTWWNGTLISFNRSVIEKNLRLNEKLEITFYTRNVRTFESLLGVARMPPPDNTIRVYQVSLGGYFETSVRKRKRSLDTVFANDGMVQNIVDRVEWFKENEEWYVSRGIPYKLVILLHGIPGVGKSSLIFALASHFNRELCSMMSINRIDKAFMGAPDNSFMLIEDIDMLAVSRDDDDDDNAPAKMIEEIANNDDKKASSLSALHVLINSLDGVATPHGLIVFITTNYKDRLDPALVRDGRIDMDIEMGPLEPKAIQRMFTAFYGKEAADRHILPAIMRKEIGTRTGAELQMIFMEEADPAKAVYRISNITMNNCVVYKNVQHT